MLDDFREVFDTMVEQVADNSYDSPLINVSGWGLEDDDVRQLAEALAQNTTVTEVRFGSNFEVSSEGMQHISDMLKVNSTLEILNLRNMELNDNDIMPLGEGVAANNGLKKLNLTDNDIVREGAVSLAKGLEKNTSITQFVIGGNLLGDDAMEAFGNMLGRNQTIEHISFQEVLPPTDKGVISLVKGIAMHPAMRSIYLPGKHVTEEGDETIADILCDAWLPNLVQAVNVSQRYHDVRGYKWAHVEELVNQLRDEGPESFSSEDLHALHVRRPAANHVRNGKIDWSVLDDYLDTLPTVEIDDTLTCESLLEADDKTGKRPVDNPRVWDEFRTISRQLLSNEAPLRVQHLLEKGKPNDFLNQIINKRKVADLFVPELWEGAGNQMRDIYNAMPEEAQAQVSGWKSLQASVGRRSAPSQGAAL